MGATPSCSLLSLSGVAGAWCWRCLTFQGRGQLWSLGDVCASLLPEIPCSCLGSGDRRLTRWLPTEGEAQWLLGPFPLSQAVGERPPGRMEEIRVSCACGRPAFSCTKLTGYRERSAWPGLRGVSSPDPPGTVWEHVVGTRLCVILKLERQIFWGPKRFIAY